MTNRKAGFLMFLIFLAFLVVSNADKQDLIAAEFRYCTEVVICAIVCELATRE